MNYIWTTSNKLKIHLLKEIVSQPANCRLVGLAANPVHLKAESCKSQNSRLPRLPIFIGQAFETSAKNKEHKRFWNQTFDKGRLKNFVLWFLLKYGEHKTVRLVEELKTLGFQYATKAGISLGIEDLKIPKKKNTLIMEAEQLSVTTVKQYKRNEITGVERFQRLIDTWHRTSERLKQEVIENFETTDILNPVYMMAFSGARGNISQVRQLVGMRGLMSNPQGQIIDFPIRSNFREGLTLTEYIISSYGARKGIVDTALRTANAGYLTRRLVDVAQHVIISNFDCGTKRGIFLTDMKEGNKTIYSLQNRLIGRVLARDVFNLQKVKIASRNLEISSDLSSSLSSIWTASRTQKGGVPFQDSQPVKIFVRSTLTCQTKNLVCQLCYGWSLAQGNLVGIGEAVGVVAAQSIGEPGTQLTMRTFHTGGVFSGDVSDQIRAPFNGFVFYDNPIAGTLIRTPEGKIAFLTKNEGSFSVFSYFPSVKLGVPLDGLNDKSAGLPVIKDIKKYKIPFYTLLFFKNGEKVLEKEVIAQISSINRQKIATDQAEFTINAELSGQFFSKLLNLKENKVGPKLKGQALAQLTRDYRTSKNNKDNQDNPKLGSIKSKKGNKSVSESQLAITKKSQKQSHQEVIVEQFNENIVDTIYEAWGWGYAWVLSGKIYQLPLASTFFPVIGDFVNNQTYMNKNRLTLSSSFGNSFKLSVPLNKFSFNTKIIKQMRVPFQSVSTIGAVGGLPATQKEGHSFSSRLTVSSGLRAFSVSPGNNSSTLRKGITTSPISVGSPASSTALKMSRKISKSYKNNMLNSLNSFNKKNLTLLKTEIISFQLSKIIYKKFGYFLKLNDSANFSINKSKVSEMPQSLEHSSQSRVQKIYSNMDSYPAGLPACQPSVSKTSILSTEDTLFLFSSLEAKSKKNSDTAAGLNFSGQNGSNLEQYKNNFVYPSRWLSSFDVFLNWFPKRFYTKIGGLIFMEPVFFDTSLSKKVLNNFFKEDDLRIDQGKVGIMAGGAIQSEIYKQSLNTKNIGTQLLKSLKKEIFTHRGPPSDRLSVQSGLSLERKGKGGCLIPFQPTEKARSPLFRQNSPLTKISLNGAFSNIAGLAKKYSPNYSIKKYFKNKKIKNVSSIYIETDGQSEIFKGSRHLQSINRIVLKQSTSSTDADANPHVWTANSRQAPPLNIKFFPTFVKRDFLKNKYKLLNHFQSSSSIGAVPAEERLSVKRLAVSPVNENQQPIPSIAKVSINKDLNFFQRGGFSIDNDISKNLIYEQYQSKQLGTVTYIGRLQSFNKNKIKSELITYGLNWKNRFKLNFNEFSSGSSSFKAEYSLKYPVKESRELKSDTVASDRLAVQYNKYMGYQNKVENLQRIFCIPQSFFNFSLEKLILNNQGLPIDYFDTLRSNCQQQGTVIQPKAPKDHAASVFDKFGPTSAETSALDWLAVQSLRFSLSLKLYERLQSVYFSSNNSTAFCQINRQGKIKIFNLGEGYFDGYVSCSNKKNKLDDWLKSDPRSFPCESPGWTASQSVHEHTSTIGYSIKKEEKYLRVVKNKPISSFNSPPFQISQISGGNIPTGSQLAIHQSESYNNEKPENIKMQLKFFYDKNFVEKLGLSFQSDGFNAVHNEYSKNSDSLLKQLRKRIKVNNSLDISKSFSLSGYSGSLKSFSKIVSFPYFLNKKSTVFLNKKIFTTTSSSLGAKIKKIKNKRKVSKTDLETCNVGDVGDVGDIGFRQPLGHLSHKKTSLDTLGLTVLNFKNSKTSPALSLLRRATGLKSAPREKEQAAALFLSSRNRRPSFSNGWTASQSAKAIKKKKQLRKNKKLNKFSLFNYYFYSLFNKNIKKNNNLYNLSNSLIENNFADCKSSTLSDSLDSLNSLNSHSSKLNDFQYRQSSGLKTDWKGTPPSFSSAVPTWDSQSEPTIFPFETSQTSVGKDSFNYNNLKKLLNKNHLKFIFLKNKFLWMQLKLKNSAERNISGLAGQPLGSITTVPTAKKISHIVSQKNLNNFLSNISKMSQTILFNSIKNKKINEICSPFLKTQLKYFFHLSKIQPIKDFLIYPPDGDSSLGSDCLSKGLFNGAIQSQSADWVVPGTQSEKTSGTVLPVSQKVCTGIYKILSLNNFLLNSSFVYSNLYFTYNKGFLYLGFIENMQPDSTGLKSDWQSVSIVPNKMDSQSTQSHSCKNIDYKSFNTLVSNTLISSTVSQSTTWMTALEMSPVQIEKRKKKLQFWLKKSLHYKKIYFKNLLRINKKLYSYLFKRNILAPASTTFPGLRASPVASKKNHSFKKKESSSFNSLKEGGLRAWDNPVSHNLNKKINISMKPGWFYFTKNISKYILYNKKFIHPGKIIAEDLIFDRESIYLEIIPLDGCFISNTVQNKPQSVQLQLNMSKSGLDISRSSVENAGVPFDCASGCPDSPAKNTQSSPNIKFTKIIKNNKSRFEPDCAPFKGTALKSRALPFTAARTLQSATDVKKSVSLETECQNTCFLVFIRKANEYKLYKDIEYKKEMRKIATASQKSDNLFQIIPTVKSNSVITDSHLNSSVNKYNALINKIKKTGFLTIFAPAPSNILRGKYTKLSTDYQSNRKLEKKQKNYSCFKALGPTVDIYTQFKTTLLNKQKIAPQIISKYPSSDLKVISNNSFYYSLIMFKNKLFNSFNSASKGTVSRSFPAPTEKQSDFQSWEVSEESSLIKGKDTELRAWDNPVSYMGQSVSPNWTEKRMLGMPDTAFLSMGSQSPPMGNLSLNINKRNSWGLSFSAITAISSINFSPFILTYKAPYSLDFPFKTPLRFFSEPYLYRSSNVKKYLTDGTGNNQLFYIKKILNNYNLKNNIYSLGGMPKMSDFIENQSKTLGGSADEKSHYLETELVGSSPTDIPSVKSRRGPVLTSAVSQPSNIIEIVKTSKVKSILSSLFSCPIAEYSLAKNLEKSILYPNYLNPAFPIKNTNQFLSNRNIIYNKKFLSKKYRSATGCQSSQNFFISASRLKSRIDNTANIAGQTLVLGSLNYFLDFSPKYKINKEIFLYRTEFESFNGNKVSSLVPFINTYTYCSFEGELIFKSLKTLIKQPNIIGDRLSVFSESLTSGHTGHLREKEQAAALFLSSRDRRPSFTSVWTASQPDQSPLKGKPSGKLNNIDPSHSTNYKKKEKPILNETSPHRTSDWTANLPNRLSRLPLKAAAHFQSGQENLENSLFSNKRLVDSCIILTKNDQHSFYLGQPEQPTHLGTAGQLQKTEADQVLNYKEIYLSLENLKKKNQYFINDTIIKFFNVLESADSQSEKHADNNIATSIGNNQQNEHLNATSKKEWEYEHSQGGCPSWKPVPVPKNNFYKINKLPIGMAQQKNKLLIGEFLVYGDQISTSLAVTKAGQIIHINKKKITLRQGQPIFVSPKSILHKYDSDFVEEQCPVITLTYQQLKTGDIIQGIPKVEQFFEARTTKRGRLFRDSLTNLLKGLFKRYCSKGQPLDQAVRQSFYKIQQIIVDGVQRVYRSQGVSIADKHLEVIVKQMTSKVRILEGGQTGFFPGEIVDLNFVEEVNTLLMRKITYEPLVLGITKASLEVDSFLSAASFQQTTRILSNAALSRKKDFLKGLKENVILGNLIPAGTGYLVYLD